jgi:hypothetical protein
MASLEKQTIQLAFGTDRKELLSNSFPSSTMNNLWRYGLYMGAYCSSTKWTASLCWCAPIPDIYVLFTKLFNRVLKYEIANVLPGRTRVSGITAIHPYQDYRY